MALPRLSGPLFDHFAASAYPARTTNRLRWSLVNTVTSTTTAGQIGTPFSMVLNDLTNTNGHQPYGYDQMRTVYQNFRVTHADFRLELVMPSGTTDTLAILVGVYPNGAVYPASGDTIDRWAEVAGTTTRIMTQDSVASRHVITQRIPIAAIEGLSPAQMAASPNYAGFSGVAVPYGPEMFIAVSNESSTTTRGVVMKLDVVFTCEWWQRVQLPQS